MVGLSIREALATAPLVFSTWRLGLPPAHDSVPSPLVAACFPETTAGKLVTDTKTAMSLAHAAFVDPVRAGQVQRLAKPHSLALCLRQRKNVYTEAVRIHPRVQIQINFLRVEIVRSQVIAQIVTKIDHVMIKGR